MKSIAYVRYADVFYDSRATKEIKALLDAGFQVTVLGWDRTGHAEEKCKETFRGYDNVALRFYPQPVNGIGLRDIGKLAGWFRWVASTLKSLPRVDAVHACDLDGALGARGFCKRRRVKLVYDIYDYYVDNHLTIPGVIKGPVEKTEINVINQADLTIICTEERKAQIEKARPKKLIVVHNSPEMPAVPDCETEYDYVYCGKLGKERLLGDILDGYESNSDLRFYLGGLGACAEQAGALSKKHANFRFDGLLSYDQVLAAEAKGVCLSAIYDPSWKNHQLCAPNKFYEALALGKPVIVCRGTGIDQIVERNQVGRVIEYRADQFYEAVRYFKAHPEECAQIRLRARALYENTYHWQIMKARLVNAYKEL